MTTCCVTTNHHDQSICPVNGKEYKVVSEKTILHHVKQPWHWKDKKQRYYFCDDPACDVVYFGQDNAVIEQSDIRTAVGIKEKLDTSLVCYCFGVTFNEASMNPAIKAFVIDKTKSKMCECEARNPSGKCCLKDFPSN